jgi:hypothetical protein
MIKARRLNSEGLTKYSTWLESHSGPLPPADLLNDESFGAPFGDYDIDPDRVFDSRWAFGEYLNKCLSGANFNGLMSPDSDGLWAWLTLVYFKQLTEKGIRRLEHYLVIRKGSAGSLAYRNAARTSYELVHIHRANAEICLKSPMHTFGELTEQLASRQTIAHNRGFFQTAFDLYMNDGKLKRGASSKPKKPIDRQPGDRVIPPFLAAVRSRAG